MQIQAADLKAFLKTPVESWRLPTLEAGKAELARPDTRAQCLCSCGQLMETKKRHGVTIDLCKGCGTVWLDGGELAVLLKRYEDPESPGSSPIWYALDFLVHLDWL